MPRLLQFQAKYLRILADDFDRNGVFVKMGFDRSLRLRLRRLEILLSLSTRYQSLLLLLPVHNTVCIRHSVQSSFITFPWLEPNGVLAVSMRLNGSGLPIGRFGVEERLAYCLPVRCRYPPLAAPLTCSIRHGLHGRPTTLCPSQNPREPIYIA